MKSNTRLLCSSRRGKSEGASNQCRAIVTRESPSTQSNAHTRARERRKRRLERLKVAFVETIQAGSNKAQQGIRRAASVSRQACQTEDDSVGVECVFPCPRGACHAITGVVEDRKLSGESVGRERKQYMLPVQHVKVEYQVSC